jgi:Uncharacterised nucleotidyltransferase
MPFKSSRLSPVRPDHSHSWIAGGAGAIARLFREAGEIDALNLADWDLVVRQARAAGLLARLHHIIDEQGMLGSVPPAPRAHLAAAAILALKHSRDVRWEVECIHRALSSVLERLVLLKGAAYLLADLPPAHGRIFSDVDILVPVERLESVEIALRQAGWTFGKITAYDNAYYRHWMHQIPPMTHVKRQTGVDVHHTLVARTARIKLNPRAVLDRTRRVPAHPEIHVLGPEDMVLHSATHLLNEGKFDRGLRDLDDLNLLLRRFGGDADFFPALIDRAAELDLRRPLFYALRYTARILGAPVPEVVRRADRLDPPNAALLGLIDALFERALRPEHPSCRDDLSSIALFLLYVRAHHLLMPTHILVPHLLRKAWTRRFGDD